MDTERNAQSVTEVFLQAEVVGGRRDLGEPSSYEIKLITFQEHGEQ